MGDLISRSALLELFKNLRDEHETNCISYNALYELILKQKTAYDVEAVVDKIMQLYDATENCGDECNAWNCRECYENHLRDILRNSGKE